MPNGAMLACCCGEWLCPLCGELPPDGTMRVPYNVSLVSSGIRLCDCGALPDSGGAVGQIYSDPEMLNGAWTLTPTGVECTLLETYDQWGTNEWGYSTPIISVPSGPEWSVLDKYLVRADWEQNGEPKYHTFLNIFKPSSAWKIRRCPFYVEWDEGDPPPPVGTVLRIRSHCSWSAYIGDVTLEQYMFASDCSGTPWQTRSASLYWVLTAEGYPDWKNLSLRIVGVFLYNNLTSNLSWFTFTGDSVPNLSCFPVHGTIMTNALTSCEHADTIPLAYDGIVTVGA